jgi:3-hydroxyacyl-CoA dehydrogenase
MSPISTRRHGDILIVTSNNPPVNALGHAVREGLVVPIRVGGNSAECVPAACQARPGTRPGLGRPSGR